MTVEKYLTEANMLLELNNRQQNNCMEYHLRCNRFREYAEKAQLGQAFQRDPLNRMSKANYEIPFNQNRSYMMTPQRPKNQQNITRGHQEVNKMACWTLDPESDRLTLRTELTHTTQFKNQHKERASSTPKQNTSFCVSQSSQSSKKRKSHFLTVVSRLPGMSKNKKINFP